MNAILFDDFANMGNHIYEIADSGKTAAAALFLEDATDLMKWLLEYNDVFVKTINIEEYDAWEYYVILDSNMGLSVLPAYTTEGIVIPHDEVDVMLFDKDAAPELYMCNNCLQYRIEYNPEDDICGDCCEDCMNCSHNQAADAIDSAFGFIEYLIDNLKE